MVFNNRRGRGAMTTEHALAADHRHTNTPFPVIPPRELLNAAGELLRALAAPVRIAIVLQLRESQRCVH
jgi:hypothetical protein